MTDRYRPYRPTTLRGRAFRSLVNVAARASGLAHRVDQGWPRFEGGPRGDAPPIVLVHGFGVDGTTMLQLGRLLVRKHRVIVPDLPGFGLHGTATTPSGIESYLAAMDDLIERLGLGRPILVGSSMGGAIVANFAATRPAVPSGIGLIGPAGIEPPIESEVFAAAKRDEHLLRIHDLESFERIYALNFTKPPWMPRFLKRVVAAEARPRSEEHESILRSLEEIMLSGPERYRTITCPVEIVWGGDDRIIDPSAMELWTSVLPEAGTTIVEDAGHSTMVERPREVAEVVERLAARVEAHAGG